jgi:hypothetical protein
MYGGINPAQKERSQIGRSILKLPLFAKALLVLVSVKHPRLSISLADLHIHLHRKL